MYNLLAEYTKAIGERNRPVPFCEHVHDALALLFIFRVIIWIFFIYFKFFSIFEKRPILLILILKSLQISKIVGFYGKLYDTVGLYRILFDTERVKKSDQAALNFIY